MSGWSDISVDFDAERSYAPGDTIEGTASLKFTSPTRLKDIQVKLIGTATAQIRVRENKKTITHTETHDLIFDSLTVFPPPEMSGVLTSAEYTVPAGVSEYPFHFKLPLNAHCGDEEERNKTNFATSEHEQRYASHPPDFNSKMTHLTHSPLPRSFSRNHFDTRNAMANVKYVIKVTVHKTAFFSLNKYQFFPFQVNTPPSLSEMDTKGLKYDTLTSDPVTIKKTRSDQPAQGWISSLFNPQMKYPVTFRVICGYPSKVQADESLKPIVFVVSDMAPTSFMDYRDNVDEKGEKGKAFNISGNGVGIITLQQYTIETFGTTFIKAGRKEGDYDDQNPADRSLVKSTEAQQFDLVNLKPIIELGIPWLQESCEEEFAMDISECFSDSIIPNLEQEFSICNIKYENKISMELKLSSDKNAFFPKTVSFVGNLTVR